MWGLIVTLTSSMKELDCLNPRKVVIERTESNDDSRIHEPD